MIVDFTPKQWQVLEQIRHNDFFICGLHGAKRSGKTYVNNITFLNELVRVRRIADKLGVEEPMYILAGTSSTSIHNNILQDLYNTFDIEPKYDKHGAFVLAGVKVVQVYTGSISGLKRARGFTAYGAYVNEASLANETVFKEIISRCSGEGARIVWDSNPDNPNHWLKTDYIDSDDDMIIDFSFKLDDNTFLSKRYIESIKAATPNGKFYDRDILGKWTVAEGAIYADYDKSIHEVDDLPEMIRYFAGVDWGYDHYGSIVIIGEDSEGNRYLVDGIAEQYKEIDWWVDRAKEFMQVYGDIVFWADSARPEHVARFRRERIKTRNASKEVVAGIEHIAKLLKENNLFIKRGVIPRFFDEIYQYKWKANSTKDEPLKEYDDVLDALRYALYSQWLTDNRPTGNQFDVLRQGLKN
ncbi:TPA: PBSX family phage terminase large subunit [Streptococcus agalactiae]|uniref:PBSX family phage terminase large subunit n=1 Tax=Streptococcus agalactiae TaxID=1311 RepID=UPI0013FD04EA|nr:PBSX family phage terminase large subunit [Streptococcus agalactiae]HEN5925671.1 PBSX family phage terminase large subunit [Streptococcus agalactiae]HEN8900076.1 PBSX family phage terminase large subunit [Streptococcus agalactiae]HEO8087061.1 PBSX family phage terminase large subunit [Streptococcus agalactiae]HEO8091332.1 PBSX family phage terminase large subunit [Streptococcus agalactiae]